jgi:hypothetical protein
LVLMIFSVTSMRFMCAPVSLVEVVKRGFNALWLA